MTIDYDAAQAAIYAHLIAQDYSPEADEARREAHRLGISDEILSIAADWSELPEDLSSLSAELHDRAESGAIHGALLATEGQE